MLNSMLDNTDFLIWPIRSHVMKFLLTNIDFNIVTRAQERTSSTIGSFEYKLDRLLHHYGPRYSVEVPQGSTCKPTNEGKNLVRFMSPISAALHDMNPSDSFSVNKGRSFGPWHCNGDSPFCIILTLGEESISKEAGVLSARLSKVYTVAYIPQPFSFCYCFFFRHRIQIDSSRKFLMVWMDVSHGYCNGIWHVIFTLRLGIRTGTRVDWERCDLLYKRLCGLLP